MKNSIDNLVTAYLVFGDLHGRILPAFRLASAWSREQGVRLSGILQVGDLGYFPDPSRLDKATLLTIEREIPMKEVPEVVKKTFEAKNPSAKVQLIEEVIKVEGAKETLQYYEFHLPGDVEVCIHPDGKLRETAPAPKK